MSELIDISLPLRTDLPAWPGSSGYRLERTKSFESGDTVNESRMECGIHFGTHVDAPRHFLRDGETVDKLALEALIGPAIVTYLPACKSISAKDLDGLSLRFGIERLLLRTVNSQLWARGEKAFSRDFVALTEDAARWLVDFGIKLLGIDYLSVQRFGDGSEVHHILLQEGVILLEGLNLHGVEAGHYELICLPLNLFGAEGAPARAVLRRFSGDTTYGGSL